MILAIGIPYPEFFSFGSIKTVLRQSALIGIIAFGMVFLVAMVEIDLSVGGIFATASSLAALLIKYHHVDPWVAVAIALAAGSFLGGLNGVLTSVLKVPLIIVSLGTLSAYFGLHLILSDGKAVYGLPKDHPFFTWLGGDLFDLPVSVWTSIGCAIVLYFVFVHTRFGATVRAIGSNPAAAEFIGINTSLIRIYATALVGQIRKTSNALTYLDPCEEGEENIPKILENDKIKVPLTSYESPEEIRDDLARGAITAIVSGNFFSQAYLAVYTSAQSILDGKPLPQGWLKVPHVIIDNGKIAAYQKAWEKPETGLRAFYSEVVEATRDHLPSPLPSPDLFVHPVE